MKAKSILEFLSDQEQAKIKAFNADEVLVEAVRKVLLAVIYNNGTLRKDAPAEPLRNGALALAGLAISGRGVVTNADLGEDLRGLMQGVNLLEQGLAELAKLKDEKKTAEVESNPAV